MSRQASRLRAFSLNPSRFFLPTKGLLLMNLCYIDESGTPDIPGNTSHYVLIGLAIPVNCWKGCDKHINSIKSKYELSDMEIHTAWMMRSYPEQRKIQNFESLNYQQRRSQVKSYRTSELLRLQRSHNPKLYKQTVKNYRSTENYVHLTSQERRKLVFEIAQIISGWGFARLFAECIDKVFFDPTRAPQTIEEQAFEQIVSRYEQYLKNVINKKIQNSCGLLIHDNNPTVAKKLTILMKKFHQKGTLWTSLKHIIETPLFVNSELTGMVQIADLCSYAIRRFLENEEVDLFNLIYKRADRIGNCVVGVRHYTKADCNCRICVDHRMPVKKSFIKEIIGG